MAKSQINKSAKAEIQLLTERIYYAIKKRYTFMNKANYLGFNQHYKKRGFSIKSLM